MLKQWVAAVVLALVGVTAGAIVQGRAYHLEAAAADFIADVVDPYLIVQAALANDDLAPVGAAARSIQQAAGALGSDGKPLAAAAAKAAQARTLEAARVAFGDLSHALIAYADRTKQPIEGRIVAFCPMADKSWVQVEGTIANPYYGKSMATCGRATRKLSATK